MSLKSVENLSMNMTEISVQSEDLLVAVNDTLGKFETHSRGNSYFYNLHKHIFKGEESIAVMQSEKVILCEINAGLWDRAVSSAISTLTRCTYPHYIIIQEFLNYILNSQSDTNFGLVKELFNSLLLSHPPKPDLLDYYKAILCDHFIILNEENFADQGSFFCLLEALFSCLKTPGNLQINDEKKCMKNQGQHFMEVIDQLKNENLNDYSLRKINNKNLMYFEKLSWSEKIKRCLMLLNFIYNIFESDFAFWLQSNKSGIRFRDENTRPLLSCILWPESRNAGSITRQVNKILNIYQLVIESSDLIFPKAKIIEKLVGLVAEVIRVSDQREEIKYPFFGTNCVNYSRELSKNLSNHLVELNKEKKLQDNVPIIKLKPPWFRLLLCSHILCFITGYQCSPELTGAYDILEHIAIGEIERKEDNVERTAKLKTSVNLKTVEKFRKMKNLNAKLSEGKTLLQLACEKDNTEEIKALLTFPELDVNSTDSDGWTALHLAASKGHEPSVRELLLFRPNRNNLQKAANPRARGPNNTTPLMCAAREGHGQVCRLLLEHAGSVLLHDVNDLNKTPLKLSKNKEVRNVLKHYKKNFVHTVYSHNIIDLKPEDRELVSRLCVELIQSYFCTHRTWDVYRSLKKQNENSRKSTEEPEAHPEWDYVRYNRDIKTNVRKLRRLIHKLGKMEEFKSSSEIYSRILSFGSVS